MTADFMLLREIARYHFRREEIEGALDRIKAELDEKSQLAWAWERRAEVMETERREERDL